MKEKISVRELVALILLSVGTKLADMTPTIVSQVGKNAMWMVPIISFVTLLPSFLVLLYLFKKLQANNLVELLKKICGKYIGGILGFLFFLCIYVLTIFDTNSYVNALTTMYYPKSPELFIFIIVFVVGLWGANKGFGLISSISWMLLPYIKVIATFLIVLLLGDLVWLRVFPIWGDGFTPVLIEGIKKGSIFGDLFLYTMAYGLLGHKSFKKGISIGGIFVLFELTLFFLIYIVFFDYKSIDSIAYPFHEITQYVSIGTFFTNIEVFFMAFWLLATFLRFIIYFYLSTWIFAAIFSIKNFRPLLVPMIFIACMFGLWMDEPIRNVLVHFSLLMDLSTSVYFFIPLLLWAISKVRGQLKG